MSMLKKSDPPLSAPKIKESTIIFDEFFKIRRDRLNLGTYEYHYYTLITHAAAVVILPITPEGLFVLNEEYRHPVRTSLLGCPGGYLDDEESPEAGAHRELLEETGYISENYVVMGNAYPYPGISSQRVYYIAARNAKKSSEPRLEPAEILRTILISPQELKQQILSGRLIDASLCSALFFYETLGSERQ
jgi:ADP-ribose pyrophosphatase